MLVSSRTVGGRGVGDELARMIPTLADVLRIKSYDLTEKEKDK